METIIFNNKTYYFSNGVIYNSDFLEVPRAISREILHQYYNQKDTNEMSENEFLTNLKNLKNSGLYEECLEKIYDGLHKFTSSLHFYKTVFPIITSCHRSLNEPQKAIDFWINNKAIYSTCSSVPLFTSLAAAYCDIKDYNNALKYANRAYAIQGGGMKYQTELSLVYQRIKKESQ